MNGSRASSIGCLALILLTAGCLSSSNPGTVGTSGTDSGADVSADGGAEVVLDPCAAVQCGMTCASTPDCAPYATCVFTEDGCCSSCEVLPCTDTTDCPQCTTCDAGQCVPIPGDVCDDDDDCGGDQVCLLDPAGWCGKCVTPSPCDPCPLESGKYCPPIGETHCTGGELELVQVTPCVFTATYKGEVGQDVVTLEACDDAIQNLPVNGCSLQYTSGDDTVGMVCAWCGVTPFSNDTCCKPDCDGRHCGPDGCGGSCGECEAGCMCSATGQCMGGTESVPVWYQCAHAPAMVPAGTPFPVAILARVPGSAADITTVTSVVGEAPLVQQVEILATANSCVPPGCDQEVVVLAWLEAPAPGAYDVDLGGFSFAVGASGGLISEPSCQDDCAPPLEGIDWRITALLESEGGAIAEHCADVETLEVPLSFSGACYDYSVDSEAWDPMPSEVLSCSDDRLYFGSAAPYGTDATRCSWVDEVGVPRELILGVSNGSWANASGAKVFLIER